MPASRDWYRNIIGGTDETDSTCDDQHSLAAKPLLDPTLAWLERGQAAALRMTLDPEFRQQVEQRLLRKRGRPKTVFTPIYPKLAQPTGEQVRELRLRMSWALEFTATAVGLTDAQAVSDIECSADRRGTPRKLSRWRSAGR